MDTNPTKSSSTSNFKRVGTVEEYDDQEAVTFPAEQSPPNSSHPPLTMTTSTESIRPNQLQVYLEWKDLRFEVPDPDSKGATKTILNGLYGATILIPSLPFPLSPFSLFHFSPSLPFPLSPFLSPFPPNKQTKNVRIGHVNRTFCPFPKTPTKNTKRTQKIGKTRRIRGRNRPEWLWEIKFPQLHRRKEYRRRHRRCLI